MSFPDNAANLSEVLERNRWREGSRNVPDVVEATCPRNRSSAPPSVGQNIHGQVGSSSNNNGCSLQRQRPEEIIDRRSVSTGSGPPFFFQRNEGLPGGIPVARTGPGGGRGGGRGRRVEASPSVATGGCSLCHFRNQMNPGEDLGVRRDGVEEIRTQEQGRRREEERRRAGEEGREGGRGRNGRGGWKTTSEAPDNQRLSGGDEHRVRTGTRPDIAPAPGENAIGGRSLPSNGAFVSPSVPILPDLLNSHRVPPPYEQAIAQAPSVPRSAVRGHRRATRSNVGSSRQMSVVAHLNSSEIKGCCSKRFCIRCLVAMTTFRWLLVSFGVLGLGCIATGVVLGTLQMASTGSYILHSVVFIGIGVLLLVVIVVGWRCTPSGREPCHLLFNLGDDAITSVARGRHSHRRHRCRNDSHRWFGGVLYPQFHNRCPPPTYSAAAQDYQQHLLMAQLQLAAATIHSMEYLGLPTSPPPTYRSRPVTLQRPAASQCHEPPPALAPPRCDHTPPNQPPTYQQNPLSLSGENASIDAGGALQRQESEIACGWCAVAQPDGWGQRANASTSTGVPFRLQMKNGVVMTMSGTHLTNRTIANGAESEPQQQEARNMETTT